MNTDIFADMLLGDKDYIEKYIQSEEMQEKINLSASINAIFHILVSTLSIKNEEIEKITEMYKKRIEQEMIKKIEIQLRDLGD